MIVAIISGLVSLIYTFAIFKVGVSDSKGTFFTLLYLPYILLITAYVLSMEILWVFLAIFVIERIIWGATLKEISGEDQLVWFYLVYYVPFLWIFYWATKIR
jgi:hypothetical protein